ncbi:MAG: cytochrome C [Flavobacteriales bacterium]|nr:cytochrome C [Flavobacteriales bacterium]|tara:strand:+ start:9600 stop:10820 length:1221 start_codon:yes stop_codon:yes gene_type:complete
MNQYRFFSYFILFLIILVPTSYLSADDVKAGEKLFKQNCTACHMISSARLVGPGLEGVTEKYEKEWLIKWIRNSQALIASGDERAIAIYEEYNKVAMASYDFSDQEFSDLLAYLANPPAKEEVVAATASGQIVEEGMSTSTKLMILALVLVTLVFIIGSLKNSLKSALGQETETIPETLIAQYSLFISKNINVAFVCLIAVIIIFKFTYDGLMGVGVTTNYAPAQPIAFSHKLHAGENGVDCNYCHTSARKSKHSGIPSANVCMNCHTYINEGQTDSGTKEIQKIYDALGFDPSTRTYIEGYEQKPIEWIRIHNLPDHAYFNHSQHVVAGGLECQECHGPVEEMDVLYQYSELTMGWCIDCHRDTEVKMEGNGYYTHLHEQLKEKYKGEKITVDKIGGLECAKCHY